MGNLVLTATPANSTKHILTSNLTSASYAGGCCSENLRDCLRCCYFWCTASLRERKLAGKLLLTKLEERERKLAEDAAAATADNALRRQKET